MTRKDDAAVRHHTHIRGQVFRDVTRELSHELTRAERLVVMLRYSEELTVLEIAAVLEIAVIEVERMLEHVAERVRLRLAPIYARPSIPLN